jgi:hypothetical protein
MSPTEVEEMLREATFFVDSLEELSKTELDLCFSKALDRMSLRTNFAGFEVKHGEGVYKCYYYS